MARWAAIDRVVRAVGRMVVSVDAAAELSTISTSRWTATVPMALCRRPLAEHREDVIGIVWIAQPDARRPDPGVRLRRSRHDDIHNEQNDGGHDGGATRGLACVRVSSLTETAVSKPQ